MSITLAVCVRIVILVLVSGLVVGSVRAQSPCPITKLTASDVLPGDKFGQAVAVSGDVLLVGSEEVDAQVSQGGAAYVFSREAGVWTETIRLLPSDPTQNAGFGQVVAVDRSTEDDRLVIGAPEHDCGGDVDCGQVYVFDRDGAGWVESARLEASDSDSNDIFGRAIAVEGNTIVVGAPFKGGVGAAYVFEFNGAAWVESDRLTPDAYSDQLGWSVALRGEWLFVGDNSDDEVLPNSGAVHVYRRSGSTWQFTQKLLPSMAVGGELLGGSIAVSEDTMMVGAESTLAGVPGEVFVYRLVGDTWMEVQRLVASDPVPENDGFGQALDLRGDTAIIGAPGDDDGASERGAAYVFHFRNAQWEETRKLLASTPAPITRAFGVSVALSGDVMVVGPGVDDENGSSAGAAFVLIRGEIFTGNVNTGDGTSPSDVLFVNGESGNRCKVVDVESGTQAAIAVERAPQGNGAYAFWLYDFRRYAGAPIQYRKGATTYDLGSGVKALPINNSVTPGSVPCPLTFSTGWTSMSLGPSPAAAFCLNERPGFPRAPTSFQAIFPQGNFILGGLVVDRNSINSPALNVSIANWIFVRSR